MGQNTLPFWYLLHSGYAVHYQPLLSRILLLQDREDRCESPTFLQTPGYRRHRGIHPGSRSHCSCHHETEHGKRLSTRSEIITVCIAVVPVIKDPELVMHGVDSIIVSFRTGIPWAMRESTKGEFRGVVGINKPDLHSPVFRFYQFSQNGCIICKLP